MNINFNCCPSVFHMKWKDFPAHIVWLNELNLMAPSSQKNKKDVKTKQNKQKGLSKQKKAKMNINFNWRRLVFRMNWIDFPAHIWLNDWITGVTLA